MPAARHRSTATMEASGPKGPPVKRADPLRLPWLKVGKGGPPETDMPKSEPSAKFQPKCKAMGIQRRPVMA